MFFISLEDICTDGMAIKELQSSEMASYLQLVYQLIGGVVGNLVFLEVTSERVGYHTQIITVPQFINMLAILTLISAVIIHFTYV